MSVSEVVILLSDLSVPWWVAGGRAIDLFLGFELRPHGDTDVVVRRCDQLDVQNHLDGWDLHLAKGGELIPWSKNEYLEGADKDIWCRRRATSPWALQLMFIDTDKDEWIFRRNAAIRGSVKDIGLTAASGVPYLAPEVQLLYKAKPVTLEKDQVDFEGVLPILGAKQRQWLAECLSMCFPEGHHWIAAICDAST